MIVTREEIYTAVDLRRLKVAATYQLNCRSLFYFPKEDVDDLRQTKHNKIEVCRSLLNCGFESKKLK